MPETLSKKHMAFLKFKYIWLHSNGTQHMCKSTKWWELLFAPFADNSPDGLFCLSGNPMSNFPQNKPKRGLEHVSTVFHATWHELQP